MEITKYAALTLQALSVTILGLNFAGVRVDALPRILQPLFLIPWYAYVVLFLALLAVVITTKEKIRQIGSTLPAPPALQKIDTISYKDVTWDIVAPAQHPREKPEDYARRLPTVGEARIPPKCPKCSVQLEEKKGLIWYNWLCVSCGFKKRSRDTFLIEGGRAEKIWRGKAEAAAAVPATITATLSPGAAPEDPKE
jgi:hypothetical protein